MDYRQEKIIKTWFNEGVKANCDSYFGFISFWISFNAYCVAEYSGKAQRRLAQINNQRGLRHFSESETKITEGTVLENQGEYTIDIKQPGRIKIVIKEKFIESAVFNAFAKYFQESYLEMLEEDDFSKVVKELQQALKKDDGNYYAIDMSKVRQYNRKISYEELKNRNIIIPFEDITKLRQLIDVLYQIRCNLFHGEKQPGVINDDKIVSSANPVLGAILTRLQPVEHNKLHYFDEELE